MKNCHIFLDPTGTWRGNKFPEIFMCNGYICACEIPCEKAVEKLKSEAPEISNREVIQIEKELLYTPEKVCFNCLNGAHHICAAPSTCKCNHSETPWWGYKIGVLYSWDGGCEIEYQWRPYNHGEWKNTNVYYWNEVGSSNPVAQKRQVLRLLPKSPVTDYVLERPSEDGEGVIGTVRGAAVPQAGIVATGVPEFNVRDNAIVVNGTVSGKSSSEILDEFSTLRGATGREEPEQPHEKDTHVMFADWIIENRWRKDVHTHQWERTFSYKDPEKATSEDLYVMFCKSINPSVEPSPQADSRLDLLEKQREEIIGIVFGDGSAQERIRAVKEALNIQP